MLLKQLYRDTEEKMKKALEAIVKEFATIRTGRASATLLDGITIDYYGTKTPINQVASISIPEPRTIIIQPWDKSVTKEIERAILKSDLGLNPNSDGNLIRLSIPELTEERRKNLAKHVRKLAEDGRIAIRNIRRDAGEITKKLEKDGGISEDERRMEQDRIQKLTDDHIKKVDELLGAKEKEILEF